VNRAFDPGMLEAVDASEFDDRADTPAVDDTPYMVVEMCPVCGDSDLVREADGALVDLDGVPHECPEVA